MIYYNTTCETGKILKENTTKAKTQSELVLSVFRKFDIELDPFSVLNSLIATNKINPRTPITSIRRAITNLEKDGVLIKTNTKVIGEFGRACYCWRLNQ